MFCCCTKNLYARLSIEGRWIASQHMATASKPSFKKKQPKYPTGDFGLDKNERRTLRKRLLEDKEDTMKMHVFRKLYPWQSKRDLAVHLKGSEVYNDDGLIALCKPYGISQVSDHPRTKEGSLTIVQTLASGGVPDHVPSIESTIPILKDLYNVDHLEVIKSTERWSSGLILLSTDPGVTEKVRKCFRSSQTLQKPHMTYWAVTCGMPKPVTVARRVPIGLEYVPNTGQVPVIKKEYTKSDIKKGKTKLAVVEHVTRVFNRALDMSLVEVNVHLTKNHFLRVWLAYSYSPILGDHLYGGRVKTMKGKKLLVNVQNLTSYAPQPLPDDTFSKLNLPDKAVEMIPCHLHLSKLRLFRFAKDNSDLVITAPPPDHFMWTCRQLGLMATDEETEQDVVEESS
ncbi:mitochondrial mRNA pseudouridine synthase RPUSD3-like [Penaeus japonicus]|uniref:mitochondrial mRNA pseudouridine synthase RPUSD3-like n=1 Tax=Penaeus japonicus TaxID=27405 RepID=UPI001C70DC5F|nr:mitochondrial mRNA pseudouridine synthase RPUSD3-like [Penaeus japonicus]